jgi:hypothetical protein
MLGTAAAMGSMLAMPGTVRAAGPEFAYKFGVDLPASYPTSVWAQKAADRIKTETDGRLEITIFPNGQLGSSTEMTSQLRSGALEFLSQSGPVISQLVPAASINSVGFAFMVERGARVRREVGIPVGVSWNLGLPAVADRVIREELVDLIFLGRPALANPHWPVWAARELAHNDAFSLLPLDWSWWLNNRPGSENSHGLPPLPD